ncbi:Uncharacterised protein [Mesomycoplasma conjunctivae]|nr:Uncharacterised protein [Mesomycoplasma conjunctivae]
MENKKLIIGLGAAAAGVALFAIPVGIASTTKYDGDPLKNVEEKANSISNIVFKDESIGVNTTYASLKSKLVENGHKKSDVTAFGFFDFFTTKNNQPTLITDSEWNCCEIVIKDIIADDQDQSFKVYYYVQSKLDNNDVAKSNLRVKTLSFGFLPEFSLASFAHKGQQLFKSIRPRTYGEFIATLKG